MRIPVPLCGWLVGIALISQLLAFASPAAAAPITCDHFFYQEDAQEYHDANLDSDEEIAMDIDEGGVVCGSLPARPVPPEASWQSIAASTGVMAVIGGGAWWYHQKRQTLRSALVAANKSRDEES